MLKCNGFCFVQTSKRNSDEIYKHCIVRYELIAKPVSGKPDPRSLSMDSVCQVKLRLSIPALP